MNLNFKVNKYNTFHALLPAKVSTKFLRQANPHPGVLLLLNNYQGSVLLPTADMAS
jgi:hypothetical protein